MVRKLIIRGGLGIATTTLLLVGCDRMESPAEKEATQQAGGDPKKTTVKTEEGHGHKPGSHGGIIVPVGRDSYHVEAVFVKNGTIRLHVLGKDEARLHEIDRQEIAAYVTPAGSQDAEEVKFVPQPQTGDSPGKTSLFVAHLPPALVGKTIKVVINNVQFGPGERFRLDFTNEIARHEETSGMTADVEGDAARKLYLTPGGKYGADDVKANGNVTPSQKFKGIASDHNAKPRSGDRICPISMTKANPKFTWVVGGKIHEFCCIPCIDEFVQMAKENPGAIKDPSDYVKQ